MMMVLRSKGDTKKKDSCVIYLECCNAKNGDQEGTKRWISFIVFKWRVLVIAERIILYALSITKN